MPGGSCCFGYSDGYDHYQTPIAVSHCQTAAATSASMNDLGFGVPRQLDQIGQRIDPAALFGCELLASHIRG